MRITRRGFLKAGIVAGGVAAGCRPALSEAQEGAVEAIPRRAFGKTGVRVPILALGGMFDTGSAHLLLRQAIRLGVAYWDTADCYEDGNSEIGIGHYFARNAADRDKVFLVTKVDDRHVGGVEATLARSLERLQTDRVDLLMIHGVRDPESDLSPDLRAWVDKAKKAGRIKLFGFSTHANMAKCLQVAASCGWVDGVMTTYNFRLVTDPDMNKALDACTRAGVGVTAMKFKGAGPLKPEAAPDRKAAQALLDRGFTPLQAALKVVWEDPRIASICAAMTNFATLKEYAAAALDRTKLADADLERLREHADAAGGGFCAGCAERCEAAAGGAPVADVMRFLMYDRAYGQSDRARRAFRALPPADRERLARADLAEAERRCPRGLPIASLVREARESLA